MKDDQEASMLCVKKTMRKKNHGQATGGDEMSTNSAYFSSV
jgi:hypothetical protein